MTKFYIATDGTMFSTKDVLISFGKELLQEITEEQVIQINNRELIISDGKLITNPDYQKEKELEEKKRVAMLKMTPRDFLLAITQMGVDFAKIKELMASNPQVEIELNYCNYVYRGNALLDQLCGQFGITTAQLDELFKSKGMS